MEGILALSILILIAFVAIVYIPVVMTKRAMVKVIRIFCRHNAVGVRKAKTIDELGLRPPDFFQRLLKPRDYKPYALQVLKQTGIVEMTNDGKLYINENKLEERLRCKMDFSVDRGRK
jgi:hypothetical protein